MLISALKTATIFILVCDPQAQAGYLDPGTGSSLVQGLIAVIARLSLAWKTVASFFRRVLTFK